MEIPTETKERFTEKILGLVRQIPPGRVATYGQLALYCGSPRGGRAVGRIMAACRDPEIPCHRVVDQTGRTKPAFDDYAPGTQRALLESEGVEFQENGAVFPLERYLWDGPASGAP